MRFRLTILITLFLTTILNAGNIKPSAKIFPLESISDTASLPQFIKNIRKNVGDPHPLVIVESSLKNAWIKSEGVLRKLELSKTKGIPDEIDLDDPLGPYKLPWKVGEGGKYSISFSNDNIVLRIDYEINSFGRTDYSETIHYNLSISVISGDKEIHFKPERYMEGG